MWSCLHIYISLVFSCVCVCVSVCVCVCARVRERAIDNADYQLFQMPYTLSVSVANPEAVLQPVCNISDHGLVPTKLSSWTLRLKCTRKLTTEVRKQLNIISFFPVLFLLYLFILFYFFFLLLFAINMHD